jgi:23S rRNA (cytidine1920-2'-O)/16S rRNA (cytidine1409-2'-O)-methyltransferase
VRVDGQVEIKPSTRFPVTVQLAVDLGPRFVSRGGEKLEAAIQAFQLTDLKSWNCVDVGSSTGGFTDCLLQHGAARVYTLDVGKGILHWKLRSDPRVVVMEETNARYVEFLPEPPGLVTIDASFISLRILLPVVKGWLALASPPSSPPKGEGSVIALIKPQFEAGRKESAKHKGVIRDPEIHRAILMDVLTFAGGQGFAVRGLKRSPVLGPKGNVEFLAWLAIGQETMDVQALVEQVLGE